MNSLGVEIAKLSNPTPQIFDPVDDDDTENIKLDEETHSTYQRSELRSRNAPLLEDIDSAYIGRKVSRKSRGLLFNEDVKLVTKQEKDSASSSSSDSQNSDEEEKSDEELSMNNISDFRKNFMNATSNSDLEDNGSSESDDSENSNEKDNMVSQFSNIDVNKDIEKGNSLKTQEEIWNDICKARIILQPLLILANKSPQTDSWTVIKNKSGEEVSELINKDIDALKLLLNNLINLKTELRAKSIEDKSEFEQEIPSDSEDEMETQTVNSEINAEKRGVKRKLKNNEYSELLLKLFKTEKSQRNSIIQKWDEKVRLSNGRMTQKSFNCFENSVVKQIEQVLHDKNRVIKRTQLKRSVYRVLGKPENLILKDDKLETEEPSLSQQDILLKDYDSQIFDDDDFYRQLLKAIIQSKSSVLDPTILRKQMELQTKRNKLKQKVDTKASKGRKLRYDIHPKLVNYMAPVQTATISDEARVNLLKCLFGKSASK